MPRPPCWLRTPLTGRTRYRETFWRKRLVLQVEDEVRRPRVHGDGYQGADGISVTRWRDAEPRDLTLIEYFRKCERAEQSGKTSPPPPDV